MFQNRGKFSFDEKRRALFALKPQCYLGYILHLILARFNLFSLWFLSVTKIICPLAFEPEEHFPISIGLGTFFLSVSSVNDSSTVIF